jgi:outer membrane protein, heavy metal efflux system
MRNIPLKYLINTFKIFLMLLLTISPSMASLYTPELIEKMALERSPFLEARELEKKALEQEVEFKGKWSNPQLMGQFGSLKSGGEVGATVEMGLTQAVPLSDKFSLKKQLASVAVISQKRQNQFYQNWVKHQALLSAWRVSTQYELFKHVRERASRLKMIQLHLNSRPHVTVKQKAEVAIINSLLRDLERGQNQKELDLKMALNQLEFWLGIKVRAEDLKFAVPQKYLAPGDLILSTGQDIELLKAQEQLALTNLEVEIAQKEKRPDLFLGAGYRVENVAPANHFSYVILGLNIPIWDTGSDRLEASRSRKLGDEKRLIEIQKRLALKHEDQVEKLKLAHKQLGLYPKNLLASQEKSIRSAEEGFKLGQLDANTFLQVETQTHETIDQIYISWFVYLEELSTLQLYQGEHFRWELK